MIDMPIIAATIGDIGGIGPEVCLKAAARPELRNVCLPLLIGGLAVLESAAEFSGISRRLVIVSSPEEALNADGIAVLDPGGLEEGPHPLSQPSAAAGRASLFWLQSGRELLARGKIQGLVYGPFNSDSLKLAVGEVDLDKLVQPPGSFLLRISGALRIVSLTEHLPIRAVAEAVRCEAILSLLLLLNETLVRWGMQRPRIGVAGLNPHAVGEEEREEIRPAVDTAIARGLDVQGPISPDSIFRMLLDEKLDAALTMFHDQGQIALKTTAFEGACSVMIGAPHVEVSVPHGSAYEIAGRGIAQEDSLLSAFLTAARLGRMS